jgi:hypothetical protein
MKLITAILIGLFCVGCNSKSAAQKPQELWPLWIDDSLARHESENARIVGGSAQAFENAFNLDQSCDGLKLVRWMTSTDKEKEDLLVTSKRY